MTTMDGTVPRPPAMVPADDRTPIDWRGLLVAALTIVLVALPTGLAWTIGFLARCAALITAASVEAYQAGRGPRE